MGKYTIHKVYHALPKVQNTIRMAKDVKQEVWNDIQWVEIINRRTDMNA